SPDSQWLIFIAEQAGSYDIYRIRVDGSQYENLTRSSLQKFELQWSPDGQWIIYTIFSDNSHLLYRMRPDGSQQQRLTSDGYTSRFQFSPDGQWIIFSFDQDGPDKTAYSREIYRMRANGSDRQNISQLPLSDEGPFHVHALPDYPAHP